MIELESNYTSKTVLLVAHGFVAKTIRALAKGNFSDFYDWQLSNGNMLVLENFEIPTLDADVLRGSLPTLRWLACHPYGNRFVLSSAAWEGG